MTYEIIIPPEVYGTWASYNQWRADRWKDQSWRDYDQLRHHPTYQEWCDRDGGLNFDEYLRTLPPKNKSTTKIESQDSCVLKKPNNQS